MSGAAYAQTTAPEDQMATPPASADMAAQPAPNTTDTTMSSPAPTTTTMASNTGVNVQTVTNGPVPDTPENRAKYGQPMSHAGKKTAPVGN